MPTFLLYSLKAAGCLAVFYLFYKLLLSRDTLHRMNRVLLCGVLLLSFLLPLCVITVEKELPGVSARLTFTVEGRDEQFRAEVYATESKVDIETRTFAVRALFPNRQGKQLLPGRFADVKIRMHDIPDAIAIPTEAIVPEMGVDKVYLYKGGKARAVTVRTGLRTDSSIQIIAGLNVGDTIITSGTLQLRTDLPVKLDTVE